MEQHDSGQVVSKLPVRLGTVSGGHVQHTKMSGTHSKWSETSAVFQEG